VFRAFPVALAGRLTEAHSTNVVPLDLTVQEAAFSLSGAWFC
jgi:hypothetical protein